MPTIWFGLDLLEHMQNMTKLMQQIFRTYDYKTDQNKKGLRKCARKT